MNERWIMANLVLSPVCTVLAFVFPETTTMVAADEINVFYRIECVAFQTIASFYIVISILNLYARRFEWNKDKRSKVLVKYSHFVLMTCSVIMTVWTVDPRGLFGYYSITLIIMFKDVMTLLFSSNALLYTQVLHVVFMDAEYNRRSMFANQWMSVGVPFMLLTAIQITTTVICVQLNREIYRAVFFGAVALVVGLALMLSTVMYCLLVRTEREAAGEGKVAKQQLKKSSAGLRRKLLQSCSILFLITGLEVYTMVSTLTSERTMQQSQIPNPQVYTFSFVPAIFSLGLLLCSLHSWMRWKPKESSVEGTAGGEKSSAPVSSPPKSKRSRIASAGQAAGKKGRRGRAAAGRKGVVPRKGTRTKIPADRSDDDTEDDEEEEEVEESNLLPTTTQSNLKSSGPALSRILRDSAGGASAAEESHQ
eukprot:TRINITY_DN31873_c0_g1_i1.p1 TRINITY_DN31873_c0_g1~~TRINITY_DN31873_c0_g1_i1.p1  ORF type:complete len:422 (-),score=58.83 TRINITY_DN31873_c0_g1_i1:76-1341(-)